MTALFSLPPPRTDRMGGAARPLSVLAILLAALGCGAPASPRPLAAVPSPPPKDDGQVSQGTQGGIEHAQALEELKVATLSGAADRQQSLQILLPDAPNWVRVKFSLVKSLVAFRYGRDHHAIVGGFVLHVPDENVLGACAAAFEQWTAPWIEAFEVAIEHAPPRAEQWRGKIVDIDSLVARAATLGMHDAYAASYAIYPAWRGACLVVGVAVPARGELERATAVRDRFASEVLPKLQVTAVSEPKESY